RPAEATLALVNVYDTATPWPEDIEIKSLRVYQILPMTVPSGAPPHETSLREPTAGDSVVLTRYVLGTVPVEKDGSAHFTVPARKELFFQALDENGLAIQSMRSATYLQPGERLVCQGCHEPRHRAPESAERTPLAMRRRPSRLKGDVDGTNPFSYPRLIQPVLDKHCVQCATPRILTRRRGWIEKSSRKAIGVRRNGTRLITAWRRSTVSGITGVAIGPYRASSAPAPRSCTSCCRRDTTMSNFPKRTCTASLSGSIRARSSTASMRKKAASHSLRARLSIRLLNSREDGASSIQPYSLRKET
ncbi:MAG: HzsA-related protein, partial [Planctomycetota bacterium]